MFSRRAAVAAAAGSAGAVLVGCTSPQSVTGAVASAPASSATTPSASPSPTVDARPRAPLTGEVVTSASSLNHAAVAVKVSDVQSAHPQAGLNSADIVFAEPNGVSYIRLCAVFHSRFPELVGPVRSIRPVDVPLLSPLKPVFGNTAAAHWVMNYVTSFSRYIENLYSFKAGVHGTLAYYTMPHRFRVHSVFCRPDELRKLATRNTQPPDAGYLPFATGDEQPSTAGSAKAAKTISVPWGPANTWNTGYHYDEESGKYLRSEPWGPHVLLDGKRVVTDNLLVVRAKWKMDKIFHGGGEVDPVVSIINATGTFYYAHAGTYVKGHWSKGAVNEPFSFTLDDGTPLRIAPGRTFIELPQVDAKVLFS